MRIVLSAATTGEIQPIIDLLSQNNVRWSSELEILITGIGQVATTYALTKYISANQPDMIIQAGIAGCFGDIPLGTPLFIESDSFADLGVWEQSSFKTIYDLNLADQNEHPFSMGSLLIPGKNYWLLFLWKK